MQCEICAPRRLTPILGNIVLTCARDLGQPIHIVAARGDKAAVPVITLVLPAELVIQPHQAWCLACRLACFCPDARVSVLVTGATEAVGRDSDVSAA